MSEPKGYHKAKIARGVFGEDTKIYEEIDEFADALDQGVSVMALVELSDLIGAIKGWLAKHHPSITLSDLDAMSQVTQRVFESGHREARDADAELTALAGATYQQTLDG